MKKFIAIAVVVSLLFTIAGFTASVAAKSDDGVVYSASLRSIPTSSHTLESGAVKVWSDGRVKLMINVADAYNQTYVIRMDYVSFPATFPQNHSWSFIGTITTNENGLGIAHLDLNDFTAPQGYQTIPLPPVILRPGFTVQTFTPSDVIFSTSFTVSN